MKRVSDWLAQAKAWAWMAALGLLVVVAGLAHALARALGRRDLLEVQARAEVAREAWGAQVEAAEGLDVPRAELATEAARVAEDTTEVTRRIETISARELADRINRRYAQ